MPHRLFLSGLLLLLAFVCRADGPRVAAIASAHPLATRAGLEILEQGGNAFDAAVAVTAALGVVEPAGSGLGGGGFWLLHRESDGKDVMIDGREKAPGFARRRMYLDENDTVLPGASVDGPLAGGIPGIPAGMVYISMNYGSLPLESSMAPAIRLAQQGFEVSPKLHMHISDNHELLQRFPSSAAIYLHEGMPLPAGRLLVQSDLAVTLQSLASKGIAGYYHGQMARKIVQGVQQYGGIWSVEDLESYLVLERQPFIFEYRGTRVVSASPPSSGGLALGQALKILEHFDLKNMDRVTTAHYVIEALRRVFRDRSMVMGDPDFVKIPVDRLLDEDYLEALALTIDAETATPAKALSVQMDNGNGTDTTHFSIIDTQGNRVAATLSLNRFMGSGFVIPGTGVLVNNEMNDFDIGPAQESPGRYPAEANAIQPGKRPMSSMSPTFVESGERIGILGSSGGSRIISSLLLSILDFANGGLPESWVDLPRYHHQYQPDVVTYEANAFNDDERLALISLGYTLRVFPRQYGDMQAIMWDKRTGHVYAVSDKRGEGVAVILTPD